MMLFHEILQVLFWLFEILIIFIKLGLEFGLKEIFIRWSFRSDINHFILNVFWWELVRLYLLSSLELYQFFFWLFENLIRWINIGFVFALKMIFRRWMFRCDGKHFILNVLWWERVWFHVFFPLNYINTYYFLSKLLSDGEKCSWNFLSKLSLEDGGS